MCLLDCTLGTRPAGECAGNSLGHVIATKGRLTPAAAASSRGRTPASCAGAKRLALGGGRRDVASAPYRKKAAGWFSTLRRHSVGLSKLLGCPTNCNFLEPSYPGAI